MKKTRNLYETAHNLMVKGYSVMPVGKNKRPMILHWKPYQSRFPTDEEIIKWWKDQPNANIGIITGKISGITVIDLDIYKNKLDPATILAQFPPTYTVRTGNGGYHLYYQYQEGFTISAGAYPQYPYLDIRNDGGYVVAPPSSNEGGLYTIEKDIPLAPFPIHLFPQKKPRRKLSELTGVSSGGRNDSITSFIGKLLRVENEAKWESEVWPAVQRANATYKPPLSSNELRTTFDSIVKKEKDQRSSLVLSPIQLEGGDEVEIAIFKSKNGTAYSNMGNVLAVLSTHPYYKGTIRFNTFKQDIEYNGHPLTEGDILKIQVFMQRQMGLHNISKEMVYAAISHYANENSYDEAKDWLTSLIWDNKPRLFTWLHHATGVPDDEYHRAIGSHWFMGMIRRIMDPGCTFDYCLLLVGAQGIGKTSLFRILGGPWYKSYTGAMDNKDFYLALRGAMIVDLDEGAAMYKSEAIKMKSIITETHDEFRAPYDRVIKKYPRRFVFSMSTNDTEPFRDATGNRRYWTVDAPTQIDFKWLEENRDQLFAETYYLYKEKATLPIVPRTITLDHQDNHLPEDSWSELFIKEVRKSMEYCEGSPNYSTTILDLYKAVFPQESLARVAKGQEMRIANILKKHLGMEKTRMTIEGEQKKCWVISEERQKKLQAKPLTLTPMSDMEKEVRDF